MKNTSSKLLLSVLFAAVLFIIPSPVRAEKITDFHTNVTVQGDGVIQVVETIRYDFGTLSKHGIYRDIPTQKTNQDGKRYRMEIRVSSVTDENGAPYGYSTSYFGPRDDLRIKIGNSSLYVSGLRTYVISYQVSGAITYFSEHDELYWNMSGNSWEVPVETASYEVTLPQSVPTSGINQKCFTGAYGSTDSFCKTSVHNGALTAVTTSGLGSGQGLTAVVAFPPGFVARVEPQEVVNFWNTTGGKILSVILVLLAIAWYILLPLIIPLIWWKRGRDPKSTEGPVTAWFNPPQDKAGRKLTPGETGLLVDENVDMRDIFATIVHLAQRGYLKIVEKKSNDFYFVKQKEYDGDPGIAGYEKKLLDGIFFGTTKSLGVMDIVADVATSLMNQKQESMPGEVRIKTLDMATEVSEATDKLYKSMTTAGFFPENPKTVRTTWYVLAGIALATGNIFVAIELFIFGRIMPRKTLFGVQQANVGKSLKNFLSSQERQLEFQAKNQMFFEKLLPYAIAFGVEKVWADRFKDIQLHSPDWYQGYNNRAFTTAYFLGSMNSSFSTFRSAATPTRSSSGFSSGFGGGGFSGGGGGGGGGGSW